MAIDTELAAFCADSQGAAFIRFYQMNPPGITIGCNQRWRTVIDEKQCERRGWDWMRRPTGGGALLHKEEVNYAIVASRSVLDPDLAASFRPAYDQIAAVLANAIQRLGAAPDIVQGRQPGAAVAVARSQGLCAQSLTRFEIAVGGQKAVAAAHRNWSQSVLQHGTLYFYSPTNFDRFWPAGLETEPPPGQNWYSFSHVAASYDEFVRSLETAVVCALSGSASDPPGKRLRHLPVGDEVIERRLELWVNEQWRTRR